MMKKITHYALRIFLSGVFVLTMIVILSTFSFLGIRSFVVMSGSMAPSIPMGSVIFTLKLKDYQVGDVITWQESKKVTVTHRVITKRMDEGKTSFKTKGDTNDEIDDRTIFLEDVVGKTFLTIPFMGYMVAYAKSPYGFLLCIVIPTVIIVYEEMKTIRKECVHFWKKRKEKKKIDGEKKEYY